ncbi:hypothetical protein TraAM80_00545 [Trypanosoma rangeli]|uniref:Uncharacterized protein n=1 Tax=Trypanosoma rangeli TaxID=5698 RepID=A0A3R7LD99_TRYRA|nr:uncharacterized protein TraAM80_00545 [Trypanosoma rangeli]RNF12124.1 hypothetical protein TraAM80_00545 [Trypanosoma rangeli]|eukprot:RNF12124.1 hypothetical protein TraAM80_00545 [Trypanosoma rangeli]
MAGAAGVVVEIGMWAHMKACCRCHTSTLRGECPKCGVAISSTDGSVNSRQNGTFLQGNNGLHDGAQLRQPLNSDSNNVNNSGTESGVPMDVLLPSTSAFEGRLELVELQCRMYHDQLQQVIRERDELQKKVRAMEVQRLLGTSKIRELIEENNSLRAVVEEAEVCLGVAELEQQALLAETQRLQEHLFPLQRQSDTVRPLTNTVSSNFTGSSPLLSTMAKAEVATERLLRRNLAAQGGFSGATHEMGRRELVASNEQLEARCRVLGR